MVAFVNYLNDRSASVAVFVVVDYFDVFKTYFNRNVGVGEVEFLPVLRDEVALVVEVRSFVKLSYVAFEFAVRKTYGVFLGDVSVVTVGVEFLFQYVEIVGLYDDRAFFADFSFDGVLNDYFGFADDERRNEILVLV